MKGIILLNGEPYNNNISVGESDVVVCCDGAYDWAFGKVRIDKVLGDFDSIKSKIPEGSNVYPTEKNYTDGELALNFLLPNVKEIDIYGGGGGREDHFLGNLSLLKAALNNGVFCRMITNHGIIFMKNEPFKEKCEIGETISVLPFCVNAHINSSKGLKYPLHDLTLTCDSTRGISNVTTSEEFYLEIDIGTVIIYKCGKLK